MAARKIVASPAIVTNGNVNGGGVNGNATSDVPINPWAYASQDLEQPVWRRRFSKPERLPQWPVGEPDANPKVGGRRGLRKVELFRGLRDDFRRRYGEPGNWK